MKTKELIERIKEHKLLPEITKRWKENTLDYEFEKGYDAAIDDILALFNIKSNISICTCHCHTDCLCHCLPDSCEYE